MGTSSLVKWKPTIDKTYGDINKDYVGRLPGPLRPRYPQSMGDAELLSSLTEGNPKYNAYEKDIAVVNIYFGDSTVFEYERAPKMTWLDFISGFGGICGLCLGISFVSVIELVYWFSVRLCRTLVI